MNSSNYCSDSNSETDTIAYVLCQRQPIPTELLCPFSVGEVISHSSVINLNGDVLAPLTYRPFGELTISGNVAGALPVVLAWIDPTATVNNTNLSWRDTISTKLLRGESVNIDELPADVLLNRPALNS
jgi:hypothetical protein